MDRRAAAAGLAGDGEEDPPWSIACYGGARWGGLRSPEGLDGLGGSLYRRPESVPTAAVDKNGEPPFSSLQDVVAATGTSGRARG